MNTRITIQVTDKEAYDLLRFNDIRLRTEKVFETSKAIMDGTIYQHECDRSLLDKMYELVYELHQFICEEEA